MTGSVCDGGHVWCGGVHGRGACMPGGVRGKGACMAGGVHCRGQRAWQERPPLQRTVRILLECILVLIEIIHVFFPVYIISK